MLKLLIAVHSSLLTDLLVKSLSSHFVIHNCHTSTDMQRLIETIRPDVLVVNLRLDKQDSLSVLQNCSYKPPAILALTDLVNQEVIQRATDAEIDALSLVPCSTRYITNIIDRIAEKVPSPET